MHLSEISEAQGPSRSTGESRVVLLIGNDAQFTSSLEQALAACRCSFHHAAGGADALRQIRATPFAVVITDPHACIKEGLALVDEIQEIRPEDRVILLAPNGTSEEIIAALRQRVFFCKTAPFEAREIAKYAASALEASDCPTGIEVLSAQPNWISVRMNCHELNAERLIQFFSQFQPNLPQQPREELMIAFREILNNAIEHGAQNDPTKSIHVDAIRTARAMVFQISDPGKGFRRDSIPHAAISNTPDQPIRHIEIREQSGMRPGGYGILAASGIVDELIYNEIGNEVLLIKYMPTVRP